MSESHNDSPVWSAWDAVKNEVTTFGLYTACAACWLVSGAVQLAAGHPALGILDLAIVGLNGYLAHSRFSSMRSKLKEIPAP